jgi:hypothetical protein
MALVLVLLTNAAPVAVAGIEFVVEIVVLFEGDDVPNESVAVIVAVYVVFFTKLYIVIGEEVLDPVDPVDVDAVYTILLPGEGVKVKVIE